MLHRQLYLNNHNAIKTCAYTFNSKAGENHIKNLDFNYHIDHSFTKTQPKTANSHLNT